MNLSFKLFVLIIWFSVLSIAGYAGLSSKNEFSMRDGLPGNNIKDIYEDSRGIVWLATDAGVCEFTGSKVKFRSELSILNGEQVNCIQEKKNGNLLFAVTGVGLCEFDGEKVKTLNDQLNDDFLDIHYFVLRDTSLCLGTSNGLYFTTYTNDFKSLKDSRKLNNTNVLKLSVNKNLLAIHSKENDFYQIFDFNKNKLTGTNLDHSPEIIVQTDLKLLETSDLLVELIYNKFKQNCEILQRIKTDNKTYLLLRYFDKGKEYRKLILLEKGIVSDLSDQYNLNNTFIQCLYQRENSKELWLGTKGKGLICIKNSRFSYIDAHNLEIKPNTISDIAILPEGDIIVASEQYLKKIKNGKVEQVASKIDFCKLSGKENCKLDLQIYDLESDRNGLIWIASNYGFYTYDFILGKLKYKGIATANDFIILSDGRLFCALDKKIAIFNGKGEKANDYLLNSLLAKELEISKIVESNGEVWISTRSNGILRFDLNGKFYNYDRGNSGIHNVVNDLLILPDSSIIAGGNNGIIYKLECTKNELIIKDSITKEDGLRGTSVHGFQFLNDGSLWCGTNLGVHRFKYSSWSQNSRIENRFWNLKDANFKNSGKESLVDLDGNIWVNTTDELVKIETDCSVKEDGNCEMALMNLQVHNKDWHTDFSNRDKWRKSLKDPIVLSYKQDNLTFELGYFYCENPNNTLFRYRLIGFNQDWTEWKNSTEAVYTNLQGGEYRFEFEGKCLSTGNIANYNINIVIEKAWWRTIWFIAVVVLSFFSLMFFILKFYKKRIRKEEKNRTKQFNRVIGLKIKALQYQLDPHFIFNSLNSIQSYILDNEEDLALEYLSDFSMVLRKNIKNANENFIQLSDELSYLKLYLKLEQMRFSDKFTFQIEIDPTINPLKVKLPPMIIQPFLENIIRTGLRGVDCEGKLSLNFRQEENGYVRCVITDNGNNDRTLTNNRREESVRIGNDSLQITQDRMKLLNKVISNGRTYHYSIKKTVDSKNNNKTITEIGFPKNY